MVSSITPPAVGEATASPVRGALRLFGADGFNFGDLIDLVNPLQHVPVLGNLYRRFTGDIAAPAIRVAGGALFGGPLGAAFAAASVMLKQIVNPDEASGTDPAALAQAADPRGGWLVEASRALPARPSDAAPASVLSAAAERRRGGWMVEAAYAVSASEAERSHLHRSFRAEA